MIPILIAAALTTNSFLCVGTNTVLINHTSYGVFTNQIDPNILTNVSGAYFMTNCFSYVRPSKTVNLNLNTTQIGCIDRISPNLWDSPVDPKTLELFTAATNLVIHTKLIPFITKTNDTYFIELINPDPKLILDTQTKGLRQPDGTYLKLK